MVGQAKLIPAALAWFVTRVSVLIYFVPQGHLVTGVTFSSQAAKDFAKPYIPPVKSKSGQSKSQKGKSRSKVCYTSEGNFWKCIQCYSQVYLFMKFPTSTKTNKKSGLD